jgi:hypothetical protein
VRPEILELFQRVQAITREIAEPGTPLWTTAKFILRSDGEFDVKFGYDDGEDAPVTAPPRSVTASPSPKRPWWRFWRR